MSAACQYCNKKLAKNQGIVATSCGHIFHKRCFNWHCYPYCDVCGTRYPGEKPIFFEFDYTDENKIHEQKTHLKSYEKDIKTLKKQLDESKREAKKLRSDHKVALDKLQGLKVQNGDMCGRLNELQQELEMTKINHAETLKGVKKELGMSKLQFKIAQKRADELQKELEMTKLNHEETLQGLKQTFEQTKLDVNKDKNKLKNELKDAIINLKELQEIATKADEYILMAGELQNELTQTQRELLEAQEQNIKTLKEYEQSNEKFEILNLKNRKLKIQNAHFTDVYEASEITMQKCIKKANALEETVKQLNWYLDTEINTSTQLKIENMRYKLFNTVYDAKISESENNISLLENDAGEKDKPTASIIKSSCLNSPFSESESE